MWNLQVFVIVAFCVAASLQYTPFKKCKSGEPPLEVRVSGCTTSPCIFKRGSEVEGEWDFNALVDTDNLRPVVLAKALGISTNYPLPEQDACQSLSSGNCPLKAGELATYSLKMPVLNSYPKVKFSVKFQLVDKENNVHTCFEMSGKVIA